MGQGSSKIYSNTKQLGLFSLSSNNIIQSSVTKSTGPFMSITNGSAQLSGSVPKLVLTNNLNNFCLILTNTIPINQNLGPFTIATIIDTLGIFSVSGNTININDPNNVLNTGQSVVAILSNTSGSTNTSCSPQCSVTSNDTSGVYTSGQIMSPLGTSSLLIFFSGTNLFAMSTKFQLNYTDPVNSYCTYSGSSPSSTVLMTILDLSQVFTRGPFSSSINDSGNFMGYSYVCCYGLVPFIKYQYDSNYFSYNTSSNVSTSSNVITVNTIGTYKININLYKKYDMAANPGILKVSVKPSDYSSTVDISTTNYSNTDTIVTLKDLQFFFMPGDQLSIGLTKNTNYNLGDSVNGYDCYISIVKVSDSIYDSVSSGLTVPVLDKTKIKTCSDVSMYNGSVKAYNFNLATGYLSKVQNYYQQWQVFFNEIGSFNNNNNPSQELSQTDLEYLNQRSVNYYDFLINKASSDDLQSHLIPDLVVNCCTGSSLGLNVDLSTMTCSQPSTGSGSSGDSVSVDINGSNTGSGSNNTGSSVGSNSSGSSTSTGNNTGNNNTDDSNNTGFINTYIKPYTTVDNMPYIFIILSILIIIITFIVILTKKSQNNSEMSFGKKKKQK
jgi:hypothetical protein